MPYHLVDLHIHTALSGCASPEMTPPAIVERCVAAGLSVIAITDHNSVGNAASVIEAAKGSNLIVIPGIEAQTCEDIHVVLLFSEAEKAVAFDSNVVRPNLPQSKNRPDVFGAQSVLSSTGVLLRQEESLLQSALNITIGQVFSAAREYGALVIAAHADRPMHGYLYTLGVVSSDAVPDCFEFSSRQAVVSATKRWQLFDRASIVSSDAHCLGQVVPGRTAIDMATPDFNGLRGAFLAGISERVVVLEDVL